MSNLIPQVTVLDKGLDLQTPKIVAKPGSSVDMLNYEQVDFVGQKRIDGYQRYDGRFQSFVDDFLVLESNTPGPVYNDEGELYAYCVSDGTYTDPHGVCLSESAKPADIQWGREAVAPASLHYTTLLAFNARLKSFIDELPGAVIGLHWFRDRLYAVADLRVLIVANFEGTILPNDEIYDPTLTTLYGTVLDISFDGGYAYIVTDREDWTGISEFVTTTSGATHTIISVVSGIEASFFDSRTTAQVLSEDDPGPYTYGWRFRHLGWEVPFEEGKSAFGSLTSLNQNRQGVGVEGPTSIAGDNGRPLVLTQKVNITNLPEQVNGWKSSASPTVFNLEADDVSAIDSSYVYADAYFSWDGTSGTVTAPGIDGSLLTEYPATNTVEVVV